MSGRRDLSAEARLIRVALGQEPADLLLLNARVVNVFTLSVDFCDVGIVGDRIAYLLPAGRESGEGVAEVLDLDGAYLAPALIDGHLHIESSMLTPPELAAAIVPHGTGTIIADPHEIANVVGSDGIDYMLELSRGLPLDVRIALPSSVPATPLDAAGAVLDAERLRPYYGRERVIGLAEVMDHAALFAGSADLLAKLADAPLIDGHGPGLTGRDLQAYVAAGCGSDHESTEAAEAREKLALGQWVMIRQGTAAPNLAALIELFEPPWDSRCLLVSDDRHPGDLLEDGHMDAALRLAIALGAEPLRALRMATLHAAQCFGLGDRGAVAPGRLADLISFASFEDFRVDRVWHRGRLVARGGELLARPAPMPSSAGWPVGWPAGWPVGWSQGDCAIRYARIFRSMNVGRLTERDFGVRFEETEKAALADGRLCLRAIELVPQSLLTQERLLPVRIREDLIPGVDPEQDVVRLAVLERHHGTGQFGFGYLHGYGLRSGAIASSIAHDSHNLIVAGCNERDMFLAAEAVIQMQGGLAVAEGGCVLGRLALPVAGLMSTEPAATVAAALEELKALARALGVAADIDPFMTLSFVSLPVIPDLRLLPRGLVLVREGRLLPPFEIAAP
ncbi:MAG: adenine deaminase C-terminal domain-containing protein [Bacillota bacterium]|nr:adenine deaminase C-terminal domain-containing protein [Bacillota bacterium]